MGALAYYNRFSIAPCSSLPSPLRDCVRREAAKWSVGQLQDSSRRGGTAIEEPLKSTADFGRSIFAMELAYLLV